MEKAEDVRRFNNKALAQCLIDAPSNVVSLALQELHLKFGLNLVLLIFKTPENT